MRDYRNGLKHEPMRLTSPEALGPLCVKENEDLGERLTPDVGRALMLSGRPWRMLDMADPVPWEMSCWFEQDREFGELVALSVALHPDAIVPTEFLSGPLTCQ